MIFVELLPQTTGQVFSALNPVEDCSSVDNLGLLSKLFAWFYSKHDILKDSSIN
jgi:hypothetical protein